MLNNNNIDKKESPHVHYKNMADDAIALQILDIVEKNEDVSQRKIIKQTGLAAGLVHSYMSKIINKGWVKANQVSAKRWLYYLTPEGFMEKSRLTIKYLSITLGNYREANNHVQANLQECVDNGWRKLIIVGDDDLAEISAINIKATSELELAGVLSGSADGNIIAGVETLPYEAIGAIEFDRILLCDADFVLWLNSHGKEDQMPLLIYL